MHLVSKLFRTLKAYEHEFFVLASADGSIANIFKDILYENIELP